MSTAIRHFETVTTRTLSVPVPEEFLNRRVEVVVSPCEDAPPRRPREVPSYLHGKILGDIISPIVPAEDWDCVREGDDEQYHFNNAYP